MTDEDFTKALPEPFKKLMSANAWANMMQDHLENFLNSRPIHQRTNELLFVNSDGEIDFDDTHSMGNANVEALLKKMPRELGKIGKSNLAEDLRSFNSALIDIISNGNLRELDDGQEIEVSFQAEDVPSLPEEEYAASVDNILREAQIAEHGTNIFSRIILETRGKHDVISSAAEVLNYNFLKLVAVPLTKPIPNREFKPAETDDIKDPDSWMEKSQGTQISAYFKELVKDFLITRIKPEDGQKIDVMALKEGTPANSSKPINIRDFLHDHLPGFLEDLGAERIADNVIELASVLQEIALGVDINEKRVRTMLESEHRCGTKNDPDDIISRAYHVVQLASDQNPKFQTEASQNLLKAMHFLNTLYDEVIIDALDNMIDNDQGPPQPGM